LALFKVCGKLFDARNFGIGGLGQISRIHRLQLCKKLAAPIQQTRVVPFKLLNPRVKRSQFLNDGTPPPSFGISAMSHVQPETEAAGIYGEVLIFKPTGMHQCTQVVDMPPLSTAVVYGSTKQPLAFGCA
jgi:hypothetical protein